MGLNDLLLEIKQDPNNLLGDETIESKVLRQVLSLVEDKISEVKNQAVKWYVYICWIYFSIQHVCQSRSTHQDNSRVADGICRRPPHRFLGRKGR